MYEATPESTARTTQRYAKCIEASKRICWDIDRDVIRGRKFELFTQTHYRSSIEPDSNLSELWCDVFLFHWKEESQHAIMDELEWRREHERLNETQRDQGVNELIELVAAVDGIVQMQAEADADYFVLRAGRTFSSAEETALRDVLLKAYRWQYVVSGVQEPRFGEVLKALVTPAQMERIGKALAPILAHVGH